MRLLPIALFCLASQVCPAQLAPLAEQLSWLAEAKGLGIVYSEAALPDTAVTVDRQALARQPIAEGFDRLTRPFALRYTLIGSQVVVAPGRPRLDVSGYVADAASGEPLAGATVYLPKQERGAVTNAYGYFTLLGLVGRTRAYVSYTGYTADTVTFAPGRERVQVRLRPSIELATVEVRGQRFRVPEIPVPRRTVAGPAVLEDSELRFGERDLNAWLGLLPGVQSLPGGFRGYSIRGADPSQNLVLLDDAVLYLPSHAAGYVSAVPGDAIRSLRLDKHAGPVRYGDRVGGTLDVRLKEGSRERHATTFQVGLLSIGASTEGPLGGGSYYVNARRGLSDFWLAVLRPSVQPASTSIPDIDLRFYDLTGKVNVPLGERQRVYFSVYAGADAYRDQDQAFEADGLLLDAFLDQSTRSWSNVIASLRHTVSVGDAGFLSTAATLSRFRYDALDYFALEEGRGGDDPVTTYAQNIYGTALVDLGLRSDYELAQSPVLRWRLGLDTRNHRYSVGATNETAGRGNVPGAAPEPVNVSEVAFPELSTLDAAAYASAQYTPSGAFELDLGMRLSSQLARGSSFAKWLPRATATARPWGNVEVVVDAGRAVQYIHLIATQHPGLARDLWVPSVNGLEPQRAWYASLSATCDPNPALRLSATAYTSRLRGLTRFAVEPKSTELSDWAEDVEVGEGEARGVEASASYRPVAWLRLRGAYTLARATRTFRRGEGGRDPDRERFGFDRRHAGNAQVAVDWPGGLATAVTWRVGSGMPTRLPQRNPEANLPSTNVPFTNSWWTYGGEQVELPRFHALDVGFRYRWGDDAIAYRLAAGVQNVYLRRNPLFLNLQRRDNAGPGESAYRLSQVSGLPVLPFLSYAVTF